MSKINIPDFSNAKIKDEVWDAAINERGYIFQISCNKESRYPISVRYPNGESRTFTFEGREDADDPFPRLFWQPFNVPQECLTRPVDPLPPNGTVVWGKDLSNGIWMIGYVARHESGKMYLRREPYGATGFLIPVDEVTTEDPYKDKSDG